MVTFWPQTHQPCGPGCCSSSVCGSSMCDKPISSLRAPSAGAPSMGCSLPRPRPLAPAGGASASRPIAIASCGSASTSPIRPERAGARRQWRRPGQRNSGGSARLPAANSTGASLARERPPSHAPALSTGRPVLRGTRGDGAAAGQAAGHRPRTRPLRPSGSFGWRSTRRSTRSRNHSCRAAGAPGCPRRRYSTCSVVCGATTSTRPRARRRWACRPARSAGPESA